jgi:hypothetical protein
VGDLSGFIEGLRRLEAQEQERRATLRSRASAEVVLAEMIAEMDDDEDAAEESYLRGSGHVR